MSHESMTLLRSALVAALLVLGCGCAENRVRGESEQAPPDGAAQPSERKPPPIPEAGRLGRPRSLEQVGLSGEAMRAAIPPDNPQTPEKIALGMKLFFDGRLSADGTVACATCHNPELSPTERPARSASRAASVNATRRPS